MRNNKNQKVENTNNKLFLITTMKFFYLLLLTTISNQLLYNLPLIHNNNTITITYSVTSNINHTNCDLHLNIYNNDTIITDLKITKNFTNNVNVTNNYKFTIYNTKCAYQNKTIILKIYTKNNITIHVLINFNEKLNVIDDVPKLPEPLRYLVVLLLIIIFVLIFIVIGIPIFCIITPPEIQEMLCNYKEHSKQKPQNKINKKIQIFIDEHIAKKLNNEHLVIANSAPEVYTDIRILIN